MQWETSLQSHQDLFNVATTYRLVIQVSGNDVGNPVRIVLEIDWDGNFNKPNVISFDPAQ